MQRMSYGVRQVMQVEQAKRKEVRGTAAQGQQRPKAIN